MFSLINVYYIEIKYFIQLKNIKLFSVEIGFLILTPCKFSISLSKFNFIL